jgi:hypothetical protein
MTQKSLIAIANERVPFTTALAWAGISAGERGRGVKVTCPFCGGSGSLRVWSDHGFCFSERKSVTAVRLLAGHWDMEWEDAAIQALERIGYVPPDYAEKFAELVRTQPEPARDELADALRIWCAARCPDWQARQFDPFTSKVLSACLAKLPLVKSAGDCDAWLGRCKIIMGKALARPFPSPLNLG